MITVRVSAMLPAALAQRAHAIAQAVSQHPACALLSATVAIGADDPLVLGTRVESPLVVVPALGGRSPAAPEAALARRARAVVLLDAHDATCLGADVQVPVVWAGLPVIDEPEPTEERPASDAFARTWAEVGGGRANDQAAWMHGAGAALLAAALDAWMRGQVVVALPGSAMHPALIEGGALFARSPLEVAEATWLACRAPALVHHLASRGRRIAQRMPHMQQVADAVLQAVVLATDG